MTQSVKLFSISPDGALELHEGPRPRSHPRNPEDATREKMIE
jgi:hypothetical protein